MSSVCKYYTVKKFFYRKSIFVQIQNKTKWSLFKCQKFCSNETLINYKISSEISRSVLIIIFSNKISNKVYVKIVKTKKLKITKPHFQ